MGNDFTCSGVYAYTAIGVGVCSFNLTSGKYFSMFSVSVTKIAVTANIIQYNGSLCSGAATQYTKTYSKGICAVGTLNRRGLTNRVLDYASTAMQSAIALGKQLLPFSETDDVDDFDSDIHDAVSSSSTNPFIFDEVDDVYPILPNKISSPKVSTPMVTQASTTQATIPRRNLRGIDFPSATTSGTHSGSRIGSAAAESSAVNPNTRIQTAAFSTNLPASVNGVITK